LSKTSGSAPHRFGIGSKFLLLFNNQKSKVLRRAQQYFNEKEKRKREPPFTFRRIVERNGTAINTHSSFRIHLNSSTHYSSVILNDCSIQRCMRIGYVHSSTTHSTTQFNPIKKKTKTKKNQQKLGECYLPRASEIVGELAIKKKQTSL
jgi:hypothetical protein